MICVNQSNRGPLEKKKENKKKCGPLLTGRLRRGLSEKRETTTTTYLGCDSIELNLVFKVVFIFGDFLIFVFLYMNVFILAPAEALQLVTVRWLTGSDIVTTLIKPNFFPFLLGGPPQLGCWSDRRPELPRLLEEPSGNCQRTHIIQICFRACRYFFIFFIFSIKGRVQK